MIRAFILAFSLFTLGATLFSADAQRVRREEFDLKMQQMQQADMDGRAATAEVGARITDLNAKNAELNGKVETLEFLLSQSRDQINQMQGDDAEIARLISRLESRLATQDAKIKELETQLTNTNGLLRSFTSAAPTSFGEASTRGEASTTTSGPTTTTRRVVSTPSTGSTTTGATGQPTRITRTTTQPNGTPSTTTRTITTTRPSATGVTTSTNRLPQGTLGELPASNLPGEAGPLFAEAKSRLLRFDYEGAEGAFRTFLDQFGEDPQAGEAQYWLAEALYQQEAYAESGQAYTEMIRTYPDDPRAPEALAKLARAMRLVGDTERACNALNLLPQRYPEASGLTKNLAAGERVRSGCDS